VQARGLRRPGRGRAALTTSPAPQENAMSNFFSYAGAAEPESAPPQRAILGELSSDDWEKFIGYAARRRYPAGAVVVQAGSTARLLCFVASGQVEVRSAGAPKKAAPLQRGEGEVFGVLSFLDGAPSDITATVGAAGPAELLMLSPEALLQLAAWQPRIAVALLRDLGAFVAARLRRLQPGD
jgi:CRP-like cAMP-binding protein